MRDESVGITEEVDFLPRLDLPNISEDTLANVDCVCRLCMSSADNDPKLTMIEVSAENPYSESTPITQLFIECLNIDVDDKASKGMPRKVCLPCLVQLNSFTIFKKKSLSVNSKLRQIVLRNQKLAEAQALYGPDFYDSDTTRHYSPNPLYFETSGTGLCMPALQTTDDEVEDLLGMRSEDLPPCLDIGGMVEATLNEESDISVDFYANSSQIENTFNVSLEAEINCNVNIEDEAQNETNCIVVPDVNSNLSNVVEEVVIVDSARSSAVLQAPEVTRTDSANAPDMITSRDLQDSAVGNDDAACPPPRKVSQRKNLKRDPMRTPEVLVISDKTGEEQLALQCRSCQKVFHTHNQFQKHLAVHVEKKGVVCKCCEKWFSSLNALKRHERIHSGERPFTCVLCDRTFSQKEILQRHVSVHFDNKPFRCMHCDKSYTQKEGLNSHVKMHHQKVWEFTQYPCVLCSKSFCHASGLSRHMMIHTGRQVTCKFCDRGFYDTSSLKRHVKNKHIDKAAA